MIFDRAFCYVLAAILLAGALLATDAFTRSVAVVGALACAVIAQRVREVTL